MFGGTHEAVEWVNPLIGASTSQKLGEGKTFPGPTTPFGLVQATTLVRPQGDCGLSSAAWAAAGDGGSGLKDTIAVPASPAQDAAIPPKNLLRSLEIGVERPVSLKEFNVSVFPFIAALSMTHYTGDFVVLATCGMSSRSCLRPLVLFIAPESFPRLSRRPDLRVKRERFA